MPGESAAQQARRRRSHAESLRAKAQLLNERADRIERSADMWGRGHLGEETVGAELEKLRANGFDVLHDVRWPGRKRANIDHVAIGPPGILVVDSKNWSGNVTVQDGVLRQNGYRRVRELDGVRQAGRDVSGLLQLPWALHVIPVIALAGTGNGVQRCQDVTVVGHRDLVNWAAGLPPQLTPGDVLGIAGHLRSALPPASLPSPRQPRARGLSVGNHRLPRPPREPSARERRRAAKRAAARRENLLKLLVALVLIVAAPSLLTWWASHGTDVVRSVVPTPTFSAASSAPAPAASVFADCGALRVAFPTGVKRAGSHNVGRKPRHAPAVNTAVARANASLDRDRDGLVCESPRKKPSHRR